MNDGQMQKPLKEMFEELSAADKQQYEDEALVSLKQYQEVPCCPLSVPHAHIFHIHCTLIAPCHAPGLSASLSVPHSAHSVCLTLPGPLHSRSLRALCRRVPLSGGSSGWRNH